MGFSALPTELLQHELLEERFELSTTRFQVDNHLTFSPIVGEAGVEPAFSSSQNLRFTNKSFPRLNKKPSVIRRAYDYLKRRIKPSIGHSMVGLEVNVITNSCSYYYLYALLQIIIFFLSRASTWNRTKKNGLQDRCFAVKTIEAFVLPLLKGARSILAPKHHNQHF